LSKEKLVVMATSLEGSNKNYFLDLRSFISNQISTIPANFVKIDPVDVEIIDLKEITKNIFK